VGAENIDMNGGLPAPFAPAPFPPRPRSWASLIDHLLASADSVTEPIAWSPVRMEGLVQPWIGVQAPSLGTERAWHWDVVTPIDHEFEPLLHADPLTLAIEQDTMVVDVGRLDRPDVHVRMVVPVSSVPLTIDVSASALPPPPWFVELASGWSAPTIATAMSDWLLRNLGHVVAVSPPPPSPLDAPASDDDRFELGDGLHATTEGFDVLLSVDPRESAMVTTALRAVCDALAPYR
jgi:hypothetical protein